MTRYEGVKSHKDLDVWKKSVALSVSIYEVTRLFPREELYAMSNQMRRAAVSIASNIAEGAARRTDKDFIHFLHIALGSASELDTQVEIAHKVGFINKEKSDGLGNIIGEVSRMLYGLIRSVERRTHDH